MKRYVLVSLKRGKMKFEEKERAALPASLMNFVNQLAKEGKLVLADPFADDPDVRGIYKF